MLTPSFVKTLFIKGQQLKPVVIIGANGLTDQIHQELSQALLAHELIKIRINAESRELRDDMVEKILNRHEATKIQQIGHILVIYKHNPDKKK